MTPPDVETEKPRVLIVDDNPDVLDVLQRLLLRHGYTRVWTAPGPGEALALLNAELPDALLLDLSLSLMDDHALLRRIRQAPHWSALPVLILTGRHAAAAIHGAAQEGASGFLPQPFNGLEIVYKIEQAVRGSAARAAELTDLLRPEPAPRAACLPPSASSPAPASAPGRTSPPGGPASGGPGPEASGPLASSGVSGPASPPVARTSVVGP